MKRKTGFNPSVHNKTSLNLFFIYRYTENISDTLSGKTVLVVEVLQVYVQHTLKARTGYLGTFT